LSGINGATPNFDKLTKQGLLFTNIYATGGTSEIGNSSIFSGYPALPEISITMQPDKHRKMPSFNEDLKKWGYTSNYIFSGDLKYGNIGGYFIDHGFDVVEDEDDFPKNLKRGKLNYYDEDLYSILIKKMDKSKGPFMHCAFTGSTHSPYDYPNRGTKKWKGEEPDFMNSMYYADKCLNDFLNKCKSHSWYKNTILVFVADHGHAAPTVENPNLSAYFHIPLFIYGEPLKKEFRGQKITTLGSQADIVRTLLYQMHGDFERYYWSKDLLNPNCPQFALHTINRGYGWITPKGNFSYHMDAKNYPDLTYDKKTLKKESDRCHSFMSLIYNEYKNL
jgi:phosphoglycerol transferase MdoB-like AlkP superfamily enzyme